MSISVMYQLAQTLGIKIRDCTTDNSDCEKLLGVKIDLNLNFNDHISDLCKKKLVERYLPQLESRLLWDEAKENY